MEPTTEQTQQLKNFWDEKFFILITGASRGIGRAIALHLSSLVKSGSLFLLSARDEQKLMNLKSEMEEKNPELHVRIAKYDYSQPDSETLEKMIHDSLAAFDMIPENFARVVCFHNAGSLGDVSKKSSKIFDVKETTDYFKLNLISVISLNSTFLKIFHQCPGRYVVNTSSLCALQPMSSLSLYCTGKAARDMFFRALAMEEPGVRVLNYAPGPVDTDMLSQIENGSWDPNMSRQNQEMKEQGIALKPETTVAKLAVILAKDDYESGAHVDYFDVNL